MPTPSTRNQRISKRTPEHAAVLASKGIVATSQSAPNRANSPVSCPGFSQRDASIGVRVNETNSDNSVCRRW